MCELRFLLPKNHICKWLTFTKVVIGRGIFQIFGVHFYYFFALYAPYEYMKHISIRLEQFMIHFMLQLLRIITFHFLNLMDMAI